MTFPTDKVHDLAALAGVLFQNCIDSICVGIWLHAVFHELVRHPPCPPFALGTCLLRNHHLVVLAFASPFFFSCLVPDLSIVLAPAPYLLEGAGSAAVFAPARSSGLLAAVGLFTRESQFVGFQVSPNLSKIEKVAETCEFDGKEPLFVETTIAISITVLG